MHSVVLVDEYDKPLLETMNNKELDEHNKAVFKGFFSILKSEDAYIRFVFIRCSDSALCRDNLYDKINPV